MNLKVASAAIAEHSLNKGFTVFFIGAMPPDSFFKQLEKALGAKGASVEVVAPPHQSLSGDALAIQQAVENCKTEWFVVFNADGKMVDVRMVFRDIEEYGKRGAWFRVGPVIIGRALPARRALTQCPVNLIPQLLSGRGYAVIDDQCFPEPRIVVLTLMGAASRVEPWFLYLQRSDIPNSAKIVIADNSGDPECARLIASAAGNLRGQFRSIEIINLGASYKREDDEAYIHPGKHMHVAEKYNEVLPTLLPQSDFILFLEHDVIPPFTGFANLMALMEEKKASVTAGAYEQPEAPQYACAARGKERWTGIVEFAKMPSEPFEIGMVGGGFTLYRSEVLQRCLPFTPTFWKDPVYLLGWDGTLGRDIAALGGTIWLHPGVRCKHEFQSVNKKAK